MSQLPLHPALVHVPIGLSVIMPLVFVGLLVALWRGKVTRRAFAAATALQSVVVLGGLLSFLTGSSDEERVESFVAEALIERHEQLAIFFVAIAAVVLVISAAAFLSPEKWTRRLGTLATVGSAAVLVVGLLVGHAGGQLVYQHGAASAYTDSAPRAAADLQPSKSDD